MNTRQVADKLGTTTKILRQFLRQDSNYKNVGSAGRYTFTPRDVRLMEPRFRKWVGPRALVSKLPDTDGRKGLDPKLLDRRRTDAAVRAEFDRETQTRLATLDRMMREAGLRIPDPVE